MWQFACRRQAAYLSRLAGEPPPWSRDQILQDYRFTNAYRAADRVSQAMIRIAHGSRNETPETRLYRTLLFKVFNRTQTWARLTDAVGPPAWEDRSSLDGVREVLDGLHARREQLYSGAYVMPTGARGQPKHQWHLEMVRQILERGSARRIEEASSLEATYRTLREQEGLGDFLAFQFAIDVHYGAGARTDEARYVVAGPGALDGLSKCFTDLGDYGPADTILWMTDRQGADLDAQPEPWHDLFGRPLQPIDTQNMLCEVSKYTRVSHPDVAGKSGRTRMKRRYTPGPPLAEPVFPEHWGIQENVARWRDEHHAEPSLWTLTMPDAGRNDQGAGL
ncbi:MAG: putative DNA base hypermodification protein [Acidobacteria bacterium]|nr:putative DNA base hypermodification protein [Acidobacteriota bacterium]